MTQTEAEIQRQKEIRQAEELLFTGRQEMGFAKGLFLGRFVAFFRAVMPALAGASRMPYARFLSFNAAGGIVWGAAFVTLGFLAGNSYAAVAKTVGRDLAAIVVVIAVIVLITWQIRTRVVRS
jgi:membrane protein DedA with SNARE-associated domain